MVVSVRDAEATQQAILRVASELFMQKGYSAVSMREIARQAEVNKSLIHHHFGSKQGLWEAVKQDCFAEYFNLQMPALEQPEASAELLRDGIKAYFNWLKSNPEVVRLLAWAYLEGDTQSSAMEQALIDKGTQRIEEAQAEGKLRSDIKPLNVLITFIGMARVWFEGKDHFLQWADLDKEPADWDAAYLEDFLKILFEGLLPRTGEKQ